MLLDQQVQKVYQENYHGILTGDSEGMEKELKKKQLVISDLKAIHVVQGEVIRNHRKEKNEVKEDRDGLKKEMHLVKREIQDIGKDKNELRNARC